MPKAKWLDFARSNLLPTAALVFAIAASLGLIYWIRPDHPEPITPIDGPLVASPPVVPADRVKLADDCQVIGVTHNGKSRAYVVSAFYGSHHHVINDLLGGQPFTITFCDRNNCTRVLTRHDSTVPLNVTVGGWVGTEVFGTLLLRVGSKLYRQDTAQDLSNGEAMPFANAEYQRTTWKEWRTKYPESDVYVRFPFERMRPVPNG